MAYGHWLMRTAAALALVIVTTTADAETAPFDQWLDDLRKEAVGRNISAPVVDRALGGVQPIKRIIELDRRQPEFTQTFWRYLDQRVNTRRTNRGRKLVVQKQALLAPIAKKYGIPARFLVSFWGLETNFGDYTGKFPLFAALATLAHDARRADFFREQLLTALQLMQRGDVDETTKASWAGAMGNCQFIPSTYWAYAVDQDGDGKRDLWNSQGDIFASAGNFLAQSGWKAGETWGREVRLPKGFDLEAVGLETRKTVSQWQALGVRRIEGWDLPTSDIEGSIVLPAGRQGPAFLVYENFRTILKWNRSILYAVAVGHLADRIAGKGTFKTARPAKDIPLSRADMLDIQRILNTFGFDAGKPDGIAGSKTRAAIKAFQRKATLPPDGYPSFGLLERLRSAAGKGTRAR